MKTVRMATDSRALIMEPCPSSQPEWEDQANNNTGASDAATDGKQTPELSVSLLNDFYLKPGASAPVAVSLPDDSAPAASPAIGKDRAWISGSISTERWSRPQRSC